MLLDLLRFLRNRSISRVRSALPDPNRESPPGATLAGLERAVADDPTARNFNDLGIALLGNARTGAALAAFERAVALDPDFAAAYFNRGNAQSDQFAVQVGAL